MEMLYMDMCRVVLRGRQSVSVSVCRRVRVCACALGLLASVIPSTLLLITADSYADNFRNISSTDNVLAIVLSANFQTALESDCVARKGSNESSW